MLTLAAWSPIVVGLMVVCFVVISCMLMIIVLLQRPQGGGLSEAFGASAAGAGNTAFGARVGDALTMATIIIFIVFLGTAIALNYAVQPGEATATTSVGAGPGQDASQGAVPAAIPQGTSPIEVNAQPLDGSPESNVELFPLGDLDFPAPNEPGGRGLAPRPDETTPPVTPDDDNGDEGDQSESTDDDASNEPAQETEDDAEPQDASPDDQGR